MIIYFMYELLSVAWYIVHNAVNCLGYILFICVSLDYMLGILKTNEVSKCVNC